MGASLASAELYDPVSGRWEFTGSLATSRQWSHATLLENGKVLVAGGYANTFAVGSAETLRSGERNLDDYRLPRHQASPSHRNLAAQWQGACRWGNRCWLFLRRRTVRSGER
jgi:hypothetical protein